MSAHPEHPHRPGWVGRLGNPLGDRSGREPAAARSPLHLRLALSLVGAVAFAVLAVLLLLAYGSGWLPVVAFALAAVGVLDALVIAQRLRD